MKICLKILERFCKIYENMNRNIFLLWLQGWDKAPWLQKQVIKSWIINNPQWNIELIDENNLNNYVSDINYIYDKSKKITSQAKSDIIRLSLLKKYGGVWADSTLMCMQPLEHWVFDAISESGIWMYHGHGGGLNSDFGPASWFIVSEKNGYLISKWKKECDLFWNINNKAEEYFWMDLLFKDLLAKDDKFKNKWLKTPFLYCEEIGSSHSFANYNYKIGNETKELKEIINIKPPYVLKLSNNLINKFRNLDSKKFKESNLAYSILMSRRQFIYKHQFKSPVSIKPPIKENPLFIRFLVRTIKKIIKIL